MEINLNVGGHILPWTFGDTSKLNAWLHSVPWLNEGGVRSIKAADCTLVPLLMDAVRRDCRGHDPSGWLHIVQGDLRDDDLPAAFQEALSGTRGEITLRQLRDRLATELSERPFVFCVSAHGSIAQRVLDCATALWEQLQKLSIRYPFVVMFFCPSAESDA